MEKSEKQVIETEQLSDLATQLNQLTIISNQQVVHADIHERNEAVKARKPSGAYNQLQNPVETLEKQRYGEYRGTLSAEVKPFVTFQASKDKFNYLNKDKQKKVNLIADQGILLQWISKTTIQHTKGKSSCLQMHGLIS